MSRLASGLCDGVFSESKSFKGLSSHTNFLRSDRISGPCFPWRLSRWEGLQLSVVCCCINSLISPETLNILSHKRSICLSDILRDSWDPNVRVAAERCLAGRDGLRDPWDFQPWSRSSGMCVPFQFQPWWSILSPPFSTRLWLIKLDTTGIVSFCQLACTACGTQGSNVLQSVTVHMYIRPITLIGRLNSSNAKKKTQKICNSHYIAFFLHDNISNMLFQ